MNPGARMNMKQVDAEKEQILQRKSFQQKHRLITRYEHKENPAAVAGGIGFNLNLSVLLVGSLQTIKSTKHTAVHVIQSF